MQNPDELNWDQFNGLRRVLNGLSALAARNDPTVFPGLPENDQVLLQRMFRKLFNELGLYCALKPTSEYTKLLEGFIDKYNQSSPQIPSKRNRKQTDSELLDLITSTEFRTLIPYQKFKVDRSCLKNEESGSMSSEYHLIRNLKGSKKAYWEYLY